MNLRLQHRDREVTEGRHGSDLCVLVTSVLNASGHPATGILEVPARSQRSKFSFPMYTERGHKLRFWHRDT